MQNNPKNKSLEKNKKKPYSFYLDQIQMQLLQQLKEKDGTPFSTSLNRAMIVYYNELKKNPNVYHDAIKKLSGI